MADFIIYDPTIGGPDAHPVRGWGTCPDGLEDQQAPAPEASVLSPVPVGSLYDYLGYVYAPATETLTNNIAPSVGVSAQDVRREIAYRLRESDWTQLSDAPLTELQRAPWVAYRAALRALPGDPGFPDGVVWPDPPIDQEF